MLVSIRMKDKELYMLLDTTLKNTSVLEPKTIIRSQRLYWVMRRFQDIIFSLAALIILSPILIITALAIFLDDPKGSPIFTQIRIGRKGKPFKIYKFRSMYIDAEERLNDLLKDNEMEGPAFKIKNDPRITRVGKVIRKISIDELPQLINILKGDMSIVGPRPALPREVKEYDSYQEQRLLITPGLTCIWQIQPNRNEVTFDEWVDMDIAYIQNRSFWLDWFLILKTFTAVFKGYGE